MGRSRSAVDSRAAGHAVDGQRHLDRVAHRRPRRPQRQEAVAAALADGGPEQALVRKADLGRQHHAGQVLPGLIGGDPRRRPSDHQAQRRLHAQGGRSVGTATRPPEAR